MKKNDYMDELREMSGIDEEEIDGKSPYEDTDSGENMDSNEGFTLEGSLQYRIKIRVKDMQGFVLRHSYGSIAGWFGVLISIAAIVMVIAGWNKYGNMERIVLCILGTLFTIVQPIQLLIKAKRQVTSQDVFKEPITYNFCKEGVIISQNNESGHFLWEDVCKIVNTSKAVYIYTSPVRAIIFPKDQLGDVNKFMDFISIYYKEKCGY